MDFNQIKQKCLLETNKESEINCLFKNLNEVTILQDHINLRIRGLIDNSEDERWLPIHINDDANAIILGISRLKGRKIEQDNYVKEKMDNLSNKKWMIRWNI